MVTGVYNKSKNDIRTAPNTLGNTSRIRQVKDLSMFIHTFLMAGLFFKIEIFYNIKTWHVDGHFSDISSHAN